MASINIKSADFSEYLATMKESGTVETKTVKRGGKGGTPFMSSFSFPRKPISLVPMYPANLTYQCIQRIHRRGNSRWECEGKEIYVGYVEYYTPQCRRTERAGYADQRQEIRRGWTMKNCCVCGTRGRMASLFRRCRSHKSASWWLSTKDSSHLQDTKFYWPFVKQMIAVCTSFKGVWLQYELTVSQLLQSDAKIGCWRT